MAATFSVLRQPSAAYSASPPLSLLAALGCIAAIVQIARLIRITPTCSMAFSRQPAGPCSSRSRSSPSPSSSCSSPQTRRFTHHVGEYVLLILVATVGMMFLVATRRTCSSSSSRSNCSRLSLYILAAFDKRSARCLGGRAQILPLRRNVRRLPALRLQPALRPRPTPPACAHIAAAVAQRARGLNPLLVVAIVTIAIGLGFKVAAAPFHFWAPDVYQGAPAPSAAFIASGSKVASFFIFFQLVAHRPRRRRRHRCLAARRSAAGFPSSPLVAVVSMLLGNLVAIRQPSVRRLLAYSAVAHAGYMLLAIVAHTG